MKRKGRVVLIVAGLVVVICLGLVAVFVRAIDEVANDIAPNNTVALFRYDNLRYQPELLESYVDTFLARYPEFRADGLATWMVNPEYDNYLHIKRFYFKEEPKEIYAVRMDWPMSIWYVYEVETGNDLSIHRRDHVADSTAQEIKRIKKRFDDEVLSEVFQIIDATGMPDSVKYIRTSFH
jgi:hypothetical protein